MAIIFRMFSNSFSPMKTQFHSAWICRGFVSVTRPSMKSKIDKDTCEKVIEAAETVKHGTKEVVQEVKKVSQAVTGKVSNATGNMMADLAKKVLEKASDNAGAKNSKDVIDTAKVAAEVLKDKVSDK